MCGLFFFKDDAVIEGYELVRRTRRASRFSLMCLELLSGIGYTLFLVISV